MVIAATVDQMRTEVARILGEDQIGVKEPKWLKMMQEGVIVEVHIRRWRGRAKLDFADLGLPKNIEDEMYAHLMRLGDKKLLPMKEVNGRKVSYVDLLDNADCQARHWLDKMSFKTHWGSFVPFTMYQDWKKGDLEYQQQYFALRDEICNDYDNIEARLRNEYQAMAKVAYQRNSVLRTTSTSEATFVERFVNSIMRLVPSADTIFASFGYDVEVAYIPLPSQIEDDLARVRKSRREEDVQYEASRLKLDALRAMNDDVVRQAKEQKDKLIDTFLTDVAVQIRSLIYDTCTDVLASIQKNDGKLLGKSSGQVSNLIKAVEGLNFYGDSDIDGIIARVRSVMGGQVKDRDPKEVSKVLTDVGILTRASLIALGDTPRSGRAVGIPTTPANGVLRQARQSLGLDIKKISLSTMERKGR